ncbi:hypothetical protein BN2537_5741 [Streptomyces venezuelae]|nr:hypothetical protein BN2537_5741 [Streptomyces venezuelae]
MRHEDEPELPHPEHGPIAGAAGPDGGRSRSGRRGSGRCRRGGRCRRVGRCRDGGRCRGRGQGWVRGVVLRHDGSVPPYGPPP